MTVREGLKRVLPLQIRDMIAEARGSLAPPLLEDIVLHGYRLEVDPSPGRRLNLVIPSVSAAKAFGGVATAIEMYLEIARRCHGDLRVILDDFEPKLDLSLLHKSAQRIGVDGDKIDVVTRSETTPRVPVRAADVFVSHNWWTTLNLQSLLDQQEATFASKRPFLYFVQDYDPLFYPACSTHMAARASYQTRRACWGLFNSGELRAFFQLQGHTMARAFVFEPRLTDALRPFLLRGPAPKQKRILVYGRPSVPRNCYPSIKSGLRLWAEQYAGASGWEIVSAGLPHPPVVLSKDVTMTSLGKLSLADYADLLRTTAVGLSLMASPHPSYPPLEMSHFGVRTITNRYTCKDLSASHANILSLADVGPQSIADALAMACDGFDRDPEAGWAAATGRPSFLETGPRPFLDEVAAALEADVWGA